MGKTAIGTETGAIMTEIKTATTIESHCFRHDACLGPLTESHAEWFSGQACASTQVDFAFNNMIQAGALGLD
jgi:hypothetical protein